MLVNGCHLSFKITDRVSKREHEITFQDLRLHIFHIGIGYVTGNAVCPIHLVIALQTGFVLNCQNLLKTGSGIIIDQRYWLMMISFRVR